MSKPWKTIDPRNSRAYTCALLEIVDDGGIQRQELVEDLLMWLSEDSVRRFCQKILRDDDNECIIREESDEESDPLDDFNYVGSRHHY